MNYKKIIPAILIMTMLSVMVQAECGGVAEGIAEGDECYVMSRPDFKVTDSGWTNYDACAGGTASCFSDDNSATYVEIRDAQIIGNWTGTNTNITLTVTITKIQVMANVLSNVVNYKFKNTIAIAGETYNGTLYAVPIGASNFTYNWTTNPATASAWTLEEVNSLASGGEYDTRAGVNANAKFVESYIKVYYLPIISLDSPSDGSLIRTSNVQFNFTTNITVPTTCTLYIDDVANETTSVTVNGSNTITYTPQTNTESTSDYYVSCPTANSTTISLTTDTDYLEWNLDTPLTGKTLYIDTNFTYTLSDVSNIDNCTLYNSTAQVSYTATTVDSYISYIIPDNATFTDTFYLTCEDDVYGTDTTGTKTITMDTEPPIIISTVPSPDNTTIVDDTLSLNIYLEDSTQFDALYNITLGGVTQAYNLTQNISAGTFYFTDVIDVSGWSAGVYNVEISGGNVGGGI